MDFKRKRGFPLDGEDLLRRWPVERRVIFWISCIYVVVARNFVGVVFHVLLDGAKGSHNHQDYGCFEPPHSLNLDFQVFIFDKFFRGFD